MIIKHLDFFIETNVSNHSENDDTTIFRNFFTYFIHKIDSQDFIKDSHKRKAFTAYDTRPVGENNSTIRIHSEQHIIEGIIEGGKYAQKRNKSSVGGQNFSFGRQFFSFTRDGFRIKKTLVQ